MSKDKKYSKTPEKPNRYNRPKSPKEPLGLIDPTGKINSRGSNKYKGFNRSNDSKILEISTTIQITTLKFFNVIAGQITIIKM